MKPLKLLALGALILMSTMSYSQTKAPKKNYFVKQGDAAFNLFDFHTAIKYYTQALKKGKGDSVYLQQHLADSYWLLNDPTNAELWYEKLVAGKGGSPTNKFRYAETLRANQKYEEARKHYLIYKALVPTDGNVDQIIQGISNLQELSKDRGLYKIEVLDINTPASDFGPSYYTNGQIFFTSNRSGKRDNNLSDNWSTRNYYQIFLASPDSGAKNVSKVKIVGSCKPNGKFHDGPVAYYASNSELFFTRSNYVNSTAKTAQDKKTVKLKVYSMMFPQSKKGKIASLSFNDNEFSNAHPTLTPDGNTMYFSSDRQGGQGGTDLYMVTRSLNGTWGTPVNLGSEINSSYDEKFPFIAYDGNLYFSSNALDGLGGLDVYKTKFQNGKWTKPENLGAPINSNRDDFTFVIDSALATGYFASNREGGVGDDDIYAFTFDATKLDYSITVKVIDAKTKLPIPGASISLDSKASKAEGGIADDAGMKVFVIKGGKSCVATAKAIGYKPSKEASITSADKDGVITVPLEADIVKLIVRVKEKETLKPINDAAISVKNKEKIAMNFATDVNGSLEAEVATGSYSISSPDFKSIQGSFSEANANANGVVLLEYLIPRGEISVNVPLTANCFSSKVTVTDLSSNETYEVAPNANGVMRLDIRMNNSYLITHNERTDTISTFGLKPGGYVEGPCKFKVGQTWVIQDIYYDLDKFFIRKDAAIELDNLVKVMKENPSLEIELSSHTDCRQTAIYNLTLSARRAKAAVDYIVKKGIKSNRIVAAGYGETKLTNDCACEPTNESSCTNEQHQANRRTEVKVLKY
jgi:tetratricopeptide (TPR) repeat protein